MKHTNSLTAALGLLLLAAQGALAHEGHPRHVTMEYSNTDTKEIRIEFTNTTSDMDKALLNFCKAKDPLPADWQDGPPGNLTTTKHCAIAPLFTGMGAVMFNVTKGEHDWTPSGVGPYAVQPGTYIASVSIYPEDAVRPTHHDNGVHQTLKKFTLTLPDDEDEDD